MTSFDFEEFLWARGYDETISDKMLNHMKTLQPFSDLEMKVYSNLFLDYCVLGGIPKVIHDYNVKGSFEGSLNTQRQLIQDYKEDIWKYADGVDQSRILNVFNHIPAQLAKENKKFQISKITRNARLREYRGCVEWLDDAGIINICFCMNFPELPLQGNYDDEKYKIYLIDTGLLISTLDEESQEDLRANKNLGVYKGGIYENIAAEALFKAEYRLYYYSKDSGLELDFFVRTSNLLIPVVIKATNDSSKSLNTLIQSDKYPDFQWGVEFINRNIGFSNNIYSFPHFRMFLLKRYLTEN